MINYNGLNEDEVTKFADADNWQISEIWDEVDKQYLDGILLNRHDRQEGIGLIKGDRLIWKDDLLIISSNRIKKNKKELAYW